MQQRDALLVEMFHLIRLSEKGGSRLLFDEDEETEEDEGEEDALDAFMNRFDLRKE